MKGRETVQADIRERIRTAGYANLTKLALDLDLDYTALLNTLCGRTPSLRVIEALVKELGVPL
ncbi:MAG TPA: hypothetical protein PKK45_20455, partial [Leptospiraceae bacterium]|nr:hypothetical protein [Leptospiraceae bacterium]